MWLPLGAVRPNSGQRAGAEVHCLTGTQTDISAKTRQEKTRQEKTEVSLWLLMKYQVLGTIQMVLENWGLQAEHSPDVSSCSLRLHHRSGRPGWAGTHTPPWLHLPPKHTHTHTRRTDSQLACMDTRQILHGAITARDFLLHECVNVWMCVSVCECECRWHSYLEI